VYFSVTVYTIFKGQITDCVCSASYHSASIYASAEYWIYSVEQFGGVHAFGDNSAESKPIWMKSGAL